MQTTDEREDKMTTRATKKSWKIGELANETGLTVRALHHYDQIGLLKPSKETEGGHRVYSTADVEQLQKIITLKQLGFSLDKIKEAIASPEFSLSSATAQLRIDIEKRMADLKDIESRLRDAEHFQSNGEVRTDHILQLLSRMNLFERHLTQEQQELIKQHDLKFGPERLDELRREWLAATEELQRAMNAKLSPSDWHTKAICMRWFGLASAFTGGSLDGPYDLKRIADVEPNASLHLGLPGTDLKKVFDYIDLVLRESAKKGFPRNLGYAQIGVQNLERARRFYNAVLKVIDLQPIFQHPTEIVYGITNPELFVGTQSNDSTPLEVGNSHMIGFFTKLDERVDACYAAALSHGGTGLLAPNRESRHIYHCKFKDPDGNAIQVLHWTDDPEKPTG
jgi:MerR family transcriptional regulator, thiopeptide resistance regulator